jgi:hypothetical protein
VDVHFVVASPGSSQMLGSLQDKVTLVDGFDSVKITIKENPYSLTPKVDTSWMSAENYEDYETIKETYK